MARVFVRACAFAAILALAAAIGRAATNAGSPLVPVELSSDAADVDASAPQVALDGRGDVFAVWVEGRPTGSVTMAALEPAGGSWSRAQPLASGVGARVAVDSHGDAVVAGLRPGAKGRIFAVYRRAGAGFGSARFISGRVAGPGSGSVSVAIDDSGNALVAWSDGTQVHVATRRPGHVWTGRALGDGGDPAVAVDGHGDALVVWHVPAGGDGGFVGCWKLRGRAWQRPRSLPLPPGQLAWPAAPRLALDARGDALAVFAVWSGSIPYDTYLEADTAGRGQPFGGPQRIGAGYDGVWARLAVAPSGRAVVAYVDGRSSGSLWSTTRSAAGVAFGAAARLSDQEDVLEPAVALTPGGRMLVLWTQSDDNIAHPKLTLAGATGTASGGFGSSLPLAEIGGDCFAHRCVHGGAASVALTPGGRGAVAWVEKVNPMPSSGGIVVGANFALAEMP